MSDTFFGHLPGTPGEALRGLQTDPPVRRSGASREDHSVIKCRHFMYLYSTEAGHEGYWIIETADGRIARCEKRSLLAS